jgi:hypothetical protein
VKVVTQGVKVVTRGVKVVAPGMKVVTQGMNVFTLGINLFTPAINLFTPTVNQVTGTVFSFWMHRLNLPHYHHGVNQVTGTVFSFWRISFSFLRLTFSFRLNVFPFRTKTFSLFGEKAPPAAVLLHRQSLEIPCIGINEQSGEARAVYQLAGMVPNKLKKDSAALREWELARRVASARLSKGPEAEPSPPA